MALADLSATERRIITGYLDRVEALDLERSDRPVIERVRVIVRDGEDIVYSGSFYRSIIEAQIGNTDVTTIQIKVSNTERHSTMFVHGNDEDVISDSGFSEPGEWLEDRLVKGLAE